jgi:hypothetical protein
MNVISELAVYIGVFGMLIIVAGMVSYLASGGDDPAVLNPRYGFISHTYFIYGGSLLLLCWLLKLIVHLIDPSVPIAGPSFLWHRISSEPGYQDESFY